MSTEINLTVAPTKKYILSLKNQYYIFTKTIRQTVAKILFR